MARPIREGEILGIGRVGRGDKSVLFSIQATGGWTRLNKLMATGPMALRRAINIAARQDAVEAAEEVRSGIRSGSPGGRQFKRLSRSTINLRAAEGDSSRAPLMPQGRRLVNNIIHFAEDASTKSGRSLKPRWKVGVRPGATQGGVSLEKIARKQENGFTVTITAEMRRAFFHKVKGKGKGGVAGTGTSATGGVTIIRVPPRPFFGPVFKRRYGSGAARRFTGKADLAFRKGIV